MYEMSLNRNIVAEQASLPGIKLDWVTHTQTPQIDAVHFWDGKFTVRHELLPPDLEFAAVLGATGMKLTAMRQIWEKPFITGGIFTRVGDALGVPPCDSRTRLHRSIGTFCAPDGLLTLDKPISLLQPPSPLYTQAMQLFAEGHTWAQVLIALGYKSDKGLMRGIRRVAESRLVSFGGLVVPHLLLHAFGSGILKSVDGKIELAEPHVPPSSEPIRPKASQRFMHNNHPSATPERFQPFADDDKALWLVTPENSEFEVVGLDAFGVQFRVSVANTIVTPTGRVEELNPREKLALLLVAQGANVTDIESYCMDADRWRALVRRLGLEPDMVGYMQAARLAHQLLEPVGGDTGAAFQNHGQLKLLMAYMQTQSMLGGSDAKVLQSHRRAELSRYTGSYKLEDAPHWCGINAMLLAAYANGIDTAL